MTMKRHLVFLAIGFPPAAKSSTYRLLEIANQFAAIDWDVTVITIADESWEREFGIDASLSTSVDHRVRIVKLPIAREDLETDIRQFSKERALNPTKWVRESRKADVAIFPEPVFGAWRPDLEKAILEVHNEHPADLVMASCTPYVQLAAVRRLWDEHQVPYAIDFRDGWSLDVVKGVEAFDRDSEKGRIEAAVLEDALSLWVVNEPIAEFYRQRYPYLLDRVHVVRNGVDVESVPRGTASPPDADAGLTFGYLGSVTFPLEFLKSVLRAWRLARSRDPLVGRSRFEIRGHIGVGAARETNGHIEAIRQAEVDAVSFGGPVNKVDLASIYQKWDALILILMGGAYVTSGKVYEFMAAGVPIVSAHAIDHEAANVLNGHPLWSGNVGLDEAAIAEAICVAAHRAVDASEEDRLAARSHAEKYSRGAIMATAVRHLADLVEHGQPTPPSQVDSSGQETQ